MRIPLALTRLVVLSMLIASPISAVESAGPTKPAAPAGEPVHDEHDGHDHSGHSHGPAGPAQARMTPVEEQLTQEMTKLQQTPRKTEADQAAFLAGAEKLLRRLSTEFPSSPRHEDYMASLANLLARSGRLPEAKKLWLAYMKGLADERLLYNAYRFFADMLSDLEEGDGGPTVLREYLKSNAGSRFESETRVALARLQAKRGDSAGAAATLAEQLKLHPDITAGPIRIERDRFLMQARKFEEAMADLEAIRADSKLVALHPNATHLLGLSHESLHATTAALAEYQKLTESSDSAVPAQAHLAIAELWQKMGDGPKAVAAMKECLKKLPPGATVEPLKEKLAQLETIGKPAPPLGVPGPDGKPIELERYKGKFLLIDFWATWCGPCVEAVPELKRLVASNRGPNFEVLGISLDEKPDDKRVADFVKAKGIDWTISVPGQQAVTAVCQRYLASAIPHVVLVDPTGKTYTMGLTGNDLALAVEKALGRFK